MEDNDLDPSMQQSQQKVNDDFVDVNMKDLNDKENHL